MSSSSCSSAATTIVDTNRSLSLLNRYSVGLTAAAGTVPGVDAPGNEEILALVELFRSAPISSNVLAERSGLSRRDTNRLAKQLDDNGLIDRVPSEADRRVLLIELTRAGRRQRTRFVRSLSSFLDETTELAASIADAFDGETRPVDGRSLDVSDALAAVEAICRAGVVIADAFHSGGGTPLRRSGLVLLTIATGEAHRPSELAERLDYTSGGMAHVLDDLERGGYIERRYGALPDDRRAAIVSLTEAGDRWVASMCNAIDEAAPAISPVFAALRAGR